MLKLIFSRALEAIPTLLVLITVSFFLMRFAPGNPFSSEKTLPPEVMQNINEKYGLDKPVFEQYTTYLGNILQGDFGPSFKYKDYSVNELVSDALPVSAKVGTVAFIFTVIVGVFIGTMAALKQNTWLDYTIMSTSMIGIVLPSFVFLSGSHLYLLYLVRMVSCWRMEWWSCTIYGTSCSGHVVSLYRYLCSYHTWFYD